MKPDPQPGDPSPAPLDGYYAECAYVPTWQAELAPAWLDHVALWAGLAAPRAEPGAPFRYLEVGCGLGWTLNLLAAANPEGQFVGIDAMGEQIAQARAVARAAGLTNVRFVHATLEQVRSRRFPRFHYLVAHGVYTWVSDHNASLLFELAARVLIPGGLCYLGYNVEPGWSALRPAQQLLFTAMRDQHASHTGAAIDAARALVRQVRDLSNTRLGLAEHGSELLDRLLDMPSAYLGHEFLNAHWRPVFVTEAHARARQAALDYVGSARLALRYDDYLLRRAQRALLAAQPPGTQRELVKDSCLGQMLRTDVFVKGGHSLSLRAQRDQRAHATFALSVAPPHVHYDVQTPAGRLRFDRPAVRVLVQALASGPCRVTDVARRVPRHGCSLSALLAALDLLLFSGAIMPVDPRKAAPRATAMNALLRAGAGTGTNPASSGMAPQVGRHGTALRVAAIELLLLTHRGARPPGLRVARALLAARGLDAGQAEAGAQDLRACLRLWPTRQRWLRGFGVA
ncbi:MAG: methyltransferase regulatory domain-containing protein [Gammaproteobacteria bacterium]